MILKILKAAVMFCRKKKGSDSPAANLGCSARRRELEELQLALQLMEMECIQEQLSDEKEALKDEFIFLKRSFQKTLHECRELIQTRQEALIKKGNSVEVIEKGVLISTQLKDLDGTFEKMKEVFKRQSKQRGKKFSEELLDQRFEELQSLKQQLERLRVSFQAREAPSPMKSQSQDYMTLTEFKAKAAKQGDKLLTVPAQELREMNEEEAATVERWKMRDVEMDRQILEIGDTVSHLGEFALQIGQKAEQQSKSLQSLNQHAEETSADLLRINQQLGVALKSQSMGKWLCKLVLTLVLIGLIGFIMTTIKNRIFS